MAYPVSSCSRPSRDSSDTTSTWKWSPPPFKSVTSTTTRRRQTHRRHAARLWVEFLENRRLLSGTVTLAPSDDSILVGERVSWTATAADVAGALRRGVVGQDEACGVAGKVRVDHLLPPRLVVGVERNALEKSGSSCPIRAGRQPKHLFQAR